MQKIERVKSDGEIIAIIVRGSLDVEGISFVSPPDFSQQLGLISRKKDYEIKPHIHKLVSREVSITQEVLHIQSGKIEVTLYNKNKKKIRSVGLVAGDTILLASGGHGIRFLEDSRILEIKQGPYSGIQGDKEHF